MNTHQQLSSKSKTYARVLTIAGSDSGGGAGIQADLKTFAAIGCYGMSAITALTAQNTQGVFGIHPVPPHFAGEQLDAVFSDIGTDAVKIGMLFSAELIQTVADRLVTHNAGNIVLDPVMVAQSGDKLLQDDAIEAIKKYLMPLADIITPNLPEAEVLLGKPLSDPGMLENAAKELSRFGSRSVLIKGGHGTTQSSTDILYHADEDRCLEMTSKRFSTVNNHGTGCTLSSAIAAYLAKGNSIEQAVKAAKAYISNAIRTGAEYKLGQGHGPVHHFFKYWE